MTKKSRPSDSAGSSACTRDGSVRGGFAQAVLLGTAGGDGDGAVGAGLSEAELGLPAVQELHQLHVGDADLLHLGHAVQPGSVHEDEQLSATGGVGDA